MPGLSRVYYTNSGSEANEKAFKMVRQIAHKRYGGKKHKILYPRPRLPRHHHRHAHPLVVRIERNAQYGPYTPGFRPRAALP